MQDSSPTSSTERRQVRRALISVSDKTDLTELGRALAASETEIYSTGSTAQQLREAGVPVHDVSELTGFPECLDGRVKTLHPAVHAGILANLELEDHRDQLKELGYEPFDLVVVNLYPFAETVASGAPFESCVEMIDIGGPAMIRAAAKNYGSVAVITDPKQYPALTESILAGGTTRPQRTLWALDAFRHTAAYDVAVATWLGEQLSSGELPNWWGRVFELQRPLRYGENPHQRAALYQQISPRAAADSLANAPQLGGKEMSYNNYQDTSAALRAAFDQVEPAVAIVKHANPCGIATAESISDAYSKAFACDPVSAFGSVVAVNREVDLPTAQRISEVFTEVVAAPSYTEEAVELLRKKKNLRILEVSSAGLGDTEFTAVSGGLLVQSPDLLDAAVGDPSAPTAGDSTSLWQLVSGAAADAQTLADLEFAWRAVRSVKSNAILIAKDGGSVGIGMGQVNRVDSARLAVERANTLDEGKDRTRGAVASSDAFFPFADGLQILIDAGIKAVVAPGGSKRDAEVVEAAQAAGITLYFTGVRHFWH